MVDLLLGAFGLAAIIAGFIWLPAGVAMAAIFAVLCIIVAPRD